MKKLFLFFVICVVFLSVSCSSIGKNKNTFGDDLKSNKETSDNIDYNIEDNKIPLASCDENGNTINPEEYKPLDVRFVVENAWIENDMYYTQFKVFIENNTKNKTTSWKLEIKTPSESVFEQGWNGVYNFSDGILKVESKSYNAIIPTTNSVNIGFIISTKTTFNPTDFSISHEK